MAKVFGTEGVDNDLDGTDAADMIYGYGGDDTLDGGGGNDVLYGGAGNDKLYGGEGNDQLSGGDGDDYMIGGEGDDTYYVDSRKDLTYEAEGEGRDTVVFEGYDGELNANGVPSGGYTLRANFEVLRLQGQAGSDLSASGNDGANSISGDGNNNTLFGGGGNDSLYGYGGDDIIDGGTGNDVMDGGTGVNTVSYKSSLSGVTVDLSITGKQNTIGAGIDTLSNFQNLVGTTTDDFLFGDAQANKINGLGGNDTIRGRGGNDDLTGGAGRDTFVFDTAATNGTDRIRGFEAGFDKLDVTLANVAGSTFTIVDNTLVHTNAGVDTILATFDPTHVPTMSDIFGV